jgi:hypothetical protein
MYSLKLFSIALSLLTANYAFSSSSGLKNALSEGLARTHKPVASYKQARRYVLGHLFVVEKDEHDQLSIQSFYCGKELGAQLGSFGDLPDARRVSVDHVWAQTNFGADNKQMKKRDLHNLVPMRAYSNSLKSNKGFGLVHGGKPFAHDCLESRVGEAHVEVRDEVKGDVARIMFYFSTRYNLEIDEQQENTLRYWHVMDPVSQLERDLNSRIHRIQNTRNPFIDYPEYVSLIADF